MRCSLVLVLFIAVAAPALALDIDGDGWDDTVDRDDRGPRIAMAMGCSMSATTIGTGTGLST